MSEKRKLYFWVIAILIPIAIYMAFFYLNDPYDYFGWKGNGDTSNLAGKMLDYRNNEYENVIIGDSRLASYEPKADIMNMAYGGSMATEMNSLFWWISNNSNNSLKKVYIETGFYNMNVLLQQDRVVSTEKTIKNPFTFAFSVENAEKMISSLHSSEEIEKTAVSPEQKKKNFAAEADGMRYYLSGYQYDSKVIEDLCSVCDYCQDNNIEVAIIIPPWYSEFYELLKEHGIYDLIDDYKTVISEHAVVYDFEYESCELSDRYDDFSDQAHFHGQTFDDFIGCIERNDTTYCRVWKNGSIVKE